MASFTSSLSTTNPASKRNRLIALATVLVVATVGYALVASRAATFFASIDPSKSTLTGNARLSTGSDGVKAVQFNAPTTTTPPPTTTPPTTGGGGSGVGLCTTIPKTNTTKPTAANTGVPTGTSLTTTVPAGVQASGSSWKVVTDGTVIDGKDIVNKDIEIAANNVTIKNSRIKVPDGTYFAVAGADGGGKSGLTILNTEIYSANGALTGITTINNTTMCGLNVHGFENIMTIGSNNVILQSSYLHQNMASPGTNEPHNDVIEVRVGTGIKILGNNITQTNKDESWQHNTGAIYAAATYGKLDQVVIDGNWLGGGTYSLYMVTVNIGNAVSLGTFDVTNNKWYRNSYAYGPVDKMGGWSPRTWSNNTFEDNGQAIGQ